MDQAAVKIKISTPGSENECTALVGDFINLDQGMTADKNMGAEFLHEHCPLEIFANTPEVLTLRDVSGSTLEAHKNNPLSYQFKGSEHRITYLGTL